MESTKDLEISGHLYNFTSFTTMVARRYGKRLPRNGANSATMMTMQDAIDDCKTCEERVEWTEAWIRYHKSWNTLVPEHTEFECKRVGAEPPHDWAGMPPLEPQDDWRAAARRMSIKFAMFDIRDSPGNGGYDPDTCMAKLHVDKCMNAHNTFINAAKQYLAGLPIEGEERESSDAVPLHLIRASDMISVDMDAFEAATREYAKQSLHYGHGTEVSYDFQGLQRWVLETVVGPRPKIEAMIKLFPFAGEGLEMKDVIGGVEQVEMAQELKDSVITMDLTTLKDQQAGFDRLLECIDFIDTMGAADGDALFGDYCEEALKLNEEEIGDFGVSSSSVRTAVRLKHLKSLHALLQDHLVDPVAGLSQWYCVPLSEIQEVVLRQTAIDVEDLSKGGAHGNLALLLSAFKYILVQNLQDYKEPMPPRSADEDGLCLNSQGMYFGYLDFAEPQGGFEEGTTMMDFDWYNELFPGEFNASTPSGLNTQHIKGAYQLLKRIQEERRVKSGSDQQEGGHSANVAMWEQRVGS